MKDLAKSKIKEKILTKTIAILILVVCFAFSFISNTLAARDFKVQSATGIPFFFIEGDNGNVGISTINPGYKLDILSPDAIDSYLRVQRYDADVQAGIILATGDSTPIWTMYSDGSSEDLYFEHDGDVSLTLEDTGNVGIGTTSPNYKLSVSDGTDELGFSHDGTNAYFKTSDGSFVFQTDEGTNTATSVDIKGKGTGPGYVKIYDQDKAEYLELSNSLGYGIVQSSGTSPTQLALQYAKTQPITMFGGISSGNPYLYLYGWDTGTASRQYASLNVDASGDLSIGVQSGNVLIPTGKVGIGTITPTLGKLQVHGGNIALSPSGSYYITGLATAGSGNTYYAANIAYVNAAVEGGSGSTVGYWTASGDNIYSSNSGYVGIGTTSLTEKLEVSGNIQLVNADDAIKFLNSSTETISAAGNSIITYTTRSRHDFIGDNNNDEPSTSSLFNFFNTSTSNNLMTILKSGNVGIGTTSPVSATGVAKILQIYSTDHAGIELSEGTKDWEIYNNDWDLHFLYEGMTEVMTLEFDGDVGIGSTSPATDLDVNGNIQAAYYYDRDNSSYYLNPAAGGTGYALYSNGSIYASGSDNNYFAGNVGIGTISPQQELHVQGDVIGSVYYDLVDSNYYLDPGANIYSYGLYSKGSVYSEGTADNYFAGNIGIGTTVPDTILTIANDEWISAKDSAGTGHVNMFKVNTSNEIEVGGTLNIGTIGLAEDSGVVTLVNMPVSSTPSVGTEESYTFAIDSEPILKVYSEADGTGGIQNKRIGIGTISPDYQLTITEDFGFDDASMYIEDVSGATTVYSNNFYALNGSNYLKPADSTTSLNVAGSINVLGTTDDNYFAGNTHFEGDIFHATGTVSNGGRINLTHDSHQPQIRMYKWTGGASNFYPTYIENNAGDLQFKFGSAAEIGSESVNPYVIFKSSGNVGIGVTDPQSKLHIDGPSSEATGLANARSNSVLWLEPYSASNWGTAFGSYSGQIQYIQAMYRDQASSRTLAINPFGSNVGIGTVNPSAGKLQVHGGNIALSPSGSYYITGLATAGSSNTDYAANIAYVNAAVEGVGGVGIWQDAGTYIYPDTSSNVVIEDGGDVGIGTTSPGYKLDINTSSNTPFGWTSDKSTFTTGQTQITYTTTITGAAAQFKLVDQDNNNARAIIHAQGNAGAVEAFWVGSAGNVGIGTTVPGAKLHTYNASVDNDLLVESDATGNNIARLLLKNNQDDLATFGLIGSGGSDWPARSTVISYDASGPLVIAEGTTEMVRVDNSGNVAIGTTSAGYRLDTLSPDATDSYMRVQRYDGDVASGIMLSTGASTPLWTMYVDGSSSNLLFEENAVVSATITDDGYVGIGPDYLTPQGLLDVNNKFIVTDEQITMNVPLNLAAAGDISIASDLQFTSPTASYIKSYAPLYIEAGDPSQNVDLTLRGANSGEVIVDDILRVTDLLYLDGGAVVGADINFQDTYNLLAVNKLTVNTIDPVHEINGKEYATFVSFYAGGQKMETSGVIQLVNQVPRYSGNQEKENRSTQSPSTQVPNPQFSYIIDFKKLEEGSDLWLFWETLHQDLGKLIVILTPGFDGRVWYEKVGDSKIIIYSDQPGEVSYTLVAPRYDYKKWPNLISKTD